eukprot:1257411-Amphidinium_carterae.1
MQSMHKETEQGTLGLSARVLDLQVLQGHRLSSTSHRAEGTSLQLSLQWFWDWGTWGCNAQDAAPFQGQDFIDNVRMKVSDLAAQDAWRCEWSPVEHSWPGATPLKITWRPLKPAQEAGGKA